MFDEDAFLRAIVAAPDDCAPRLVYADWLDERSDPRAEFLRLICAWSASKNQSANPRLDALRQTLDSGWVLTVQFPTPFVHPEYAIIREVASGAATTIYEAVNTHPNLAGRRVALRILRHRNGDEQFTRACEVQAALEHPNIPRLFEVGDCSGRLYAARHFVDGADLLESIGHGMPVLEVARILTAIASALGHAHTLGVVHGYVHPRHFLLGQSSSVWLIGFGEFPPGQFEVFGNPLHLAPEQFEAAATPTPQTDVYQLAECAIWLLTGQHPFRTIPGQQMTSAKQTLHPWTTDRDFTDRLPAGTGLVVRRAMAPNPTDRYGTPIEFAREFTAAVQRWFARPWWRFWWDHQRGG